jgi:hypothetical protein
MDGTYLKATPKQPLLYKQTNKEREANDMKQTFVLLLPSNSKPFASLTARTAKAPQRRKCCTENVIEGYSMPIRWTQRRLSMASPAISFPNTVREMSTEEFTALFDGTARARLGMSGTEFIEKWKSGYFEPDPDSRPGVMEVAFLMLSL